MITTSDAIALLRFSCLVPLIPFLTNPHKLFWRNFVANNIFKTQVLRKMSEISYYAEKFTMAPCAGKLGRFYVKFPFFSSFTGQKLLES